MNVAKFDAVNLESNADHKITDSAKRCMARGLRGLARSSACVVGLAIVGLGAAQASTLTLIDPYAGPATTTSVLDINDAGWMTGNITRADGSSVGFLRDPGGVYSTFSVGLSTYGRAIDNSNKIAGYATDASGSLSTSQEFVRAPGGAVTILQNPSTHADLHGIAQGMNASGAVVGDYYTGVGSTRNGFILSGATFTDLSVPGSTRTAARAITDGGTVAGWTIVGGLMQGFIYTSGSYQLVSAPFAGAIDSYFEDLNNAGMAVGEYVDAAGNSHAFEYNINTHSFLEIPVPGANNVQAFGINEAGQVVLTTDITGGGNNFLWSPDATVPEPSTWALALVGLFAVGVARRLRHATSQLG